MFKSYHRTLIYILYLPLNLKIGIETLGIEN